MKIRLLWVLLILSSFHSSYAQENDKAVRELLKKGKSSLEKFQLDSAKLFLGSASKISEENNWWDLHFDAEFNQAMVAFVSRKQVESDSIIDRLYSKIELNNSLVNDSSVALLNYIHANLLWRQSKYLMSRQKIGEALSVGASSDVSDASYAKMLMIDGNINLHLSNYDQAIQGYLNCIELLEDKEGRLAMFIYNNLGQAYSESRNYQRGMEYYLRGFAICKKRYDSDHPYNAYFYQNIGNLYFQMEDSENGKAYYTKLINLSERILDPKDPELAKYYNNVAAFMVEESKYDSAQSFLTKSLSILGDKYHRNKRHAYNISGELMSAQGKYAEALAYFDRAIEVERQVKDGDNHFITQILARKGKTYQRMMLYDSSIVMYNQILTRISKDWKPLESGDNPDMNMLNQGFEDEAIEALLNKATAMSLMGESLNNIDPTFSLIQDLLDKLESDYLSPEEQFNLVEYESILAKLKVGVMSQAYEEDRSEEKINEIFQSIERSKARMLKLELESRHSSNLYQLDEQVFERNREVLLSIAYYKSIILSSDSQDEMDSLNALVFNLNRIKDSIETTVRERYPTVYKKKYGKQNTSIASVRDRLNENDLLVQYFLSDSAISYLLIGKDEVKFLTKEIPENLEELIQSTTIHGPQQLNPDSFFALYQMLIEPLAIGQEVSRLTIIPDKILWNVNFELLLGEQTSRETQVRAWPFLLKQMSIHYAYSASTFTDVKVSQDTNGKVLAMSFGDLDTGGNKVLIRGLENMEELPGTRDEIRRISKHLEGDYYYGDMASESAFKREAPGFTILHLALHGETVEDNPNNSRLAFYREQDQNEDGFLHAFELYGLELGAELAVLSACQTGEGQLINGEGIMSLGRAFTASGVKSLIVSRWEVPDATAPEIMETFYEELTNGKSKSESLRQAKLKYLENADNLTSHPFYWSSFYVIGSDTNVDLSSGLLIYFLIILVVIIVFIAVQIKRKRDKQSAI